MLVMTFILTLMNSILLLVIYLHLPKRDIAQEAVERAWANDRRRQEEKQAGDS
ncbi:hypothetical protein EV294_1011356 [Paenibacillus sp. BK033]|nr:hypothetical protein EV294_1011356 [Paenibacillus sp. BK033]